MARFSAANFRSPAALICFLLTAVIGLGVDLWTKRYSFDHLAPRGVETVDEEGPRKGTVQVISRREFRLASETKTGGTRGTSRSLTRLIP